MAAPCMFVGIDPGYAGAIAFLNSFGDLEVHDMPVFPNTKGKTEINLHKLVEMLAPKGNTLPVAILEKVGTMPNQGISSAFRFGEGYGALQASVIGHGYQTHFVTPAVWKKHFKLSKDKGVSRSLASHRFPASAHLFSRVKDDGRAEAALIALWGFETLSHFASQQ